MEDVFVKMADCGSGSVGTCLSSLFIMKHNCLENLSRSVYSNETAELSNDKCITLEEKEYFSSSRKFDAAEDGVLNACKNLHDSSSSTICSLASTLEDTENFKKKRCMDRYDSSESSDSGVLTGSTCSESSSNSGTSDITDPCSPYSVTSFHLGDDNGSPLALPPKSSSFSNSELLTDSKMLPENIPREEESEVSCWAWDKTIDWNERYELTSDDIDVEVKNTDYFDSIDDKHDENNDENNVEMGSNCCSQNHDSKTVINGKLNFDIPLVERKSLNSIDNYHGKDLSRGLCNSSLKSITNDTASRKVLTDNTKDFALPSALNIEDTQSYFYEKVFQQKRVVNSVENFHQLSVFDENTTGKSDAFREHNCEDELEEEEEDDDEPSDITASKPDDSVATSKFFVKNSYPLDFFNILPSVFKGPILHSADHDDGDESESERAAYGDENDDKDEHNFLGSPFAYSAGQDDLCCRSKLKDMSENMSDVSSKIVNNNNNLILSSPCLVKSTKARNRNVESEGDAKKSSKIREAITTYQGHTRFPSDRKSSFVSDRLCRWADCVDRISSSTKLIEHLQTKHVNPQTFSGTFICLWNGCKVFGRPSCSRTFLERHVLSHGGNKPYRCIVDNCGQRFSSQMMLERHVNQHFKTPKDYNDGIADTTPKLIRRNGQKLRYRRQPYSVRNRADVFDAGIMAQLQYSLVQMAQRSKTVSLNIMDSRQFLHITFQPKVIGSRKEKDGNTKYLIRWYPYNSLEDEWLPQSEIETTRTVPIWKLPASVQQLFWNSIFPNQRPTVRRSRKYKPESGDT